MHISTDNQNDQLMIQAVSLSSRVLCHSRPDDRPTVCHVIHSLGVGGAEILVDHMVRRMSSEFRCVVAVLDEVGEIGCKLQRDGVVVEHLHRQPGIDRQCAKRLRAFADQHGASLIHAHQCTPFFQAMLSRGLTGTRPVILTEHGRHFPDTPSRKRMVVNRLLLRKHDRIFGVGQATQQALIANEGLPAYRVEMIYNGVDLKALGKADPGARASVRQEFEFAADDFVVLLVARLHELKDHQTALRTIDRVRQAVPNVRLLLAGEGDQRAAIENTIAECGLQSHVKLAGTRSDIANLLAASDAFLLTSISEGIPLTVIEAMAARRPVVSTAVGGLSEMIQHGRNGFLAAAGDDAGLAQSLLQLFEHPELRTVMGAAGEKIAREMFSLDTMLKAYREVYFDVMKSVGANLAKAKS